jgi:hypothetical protein
MGPAIPLLQRVLLVSSSFLCRERRSFVTSALSAFRESFLLIDTFGSASKIFDYQTT